jgi:hypothetical protein
MGPRSRAALLCLFPLVLFLSSCRTPVPTVAGWDEPPAATAPVVADERELWEASAELRDRMEQQGLLVDDPALVGYLDGVLARVTPEALPDHAPRPAAFVLKAADRNAFVAADGGVVIASGLLGALDNEAQLAAVLAHEIGHFVDRSAIVRTRFERESRSTVERMELSRRQEFEADAFALAALRRAGYDPRELAPLFEIMESASVPSGPYAFRSHPFARQRLRKLGEEISGPTDRFEPRRTIAVSAAPVEGEVHTERFREATADFLVVAAEIELEAGHVAHARHMLDRHAQRRPDSGRGHFLRGELLRLSLPDGRYAPAVRQAWELAHRASPDDPDVVRALGLLYFDSGEEARSRPLLEHYLELEPDAIDRRMIERHLGSAAVPEPD